MVSSSYGIAWIEYTRLHPSWPLIGVSNDTAELALNVGTANEVLLRATERPGDLATRLAYTCY